MKGLRLAVIGATGNVGRPLVEQLHRQGAEVTGISRSALRQPSGPKGVQHFSVDLEGPVSGLREALQGADGVFNVAHARFSRRIIAALPEGPVRLVTLGSTRKFTRFTDEKAAQVQDAEAAHAACSNALIIHPTMIYGGADNNISRILMLLRWLALLPLPMRGLALMQPIHRDDVVQCLIAALNPKTGCEPLIVAGPCALSYAQLIRSCASTLGRRVRIISFPLWGIHALALLTRIMPGIPSITADEVRRLLEDKAFDIGPMQARLGVTPCTFEEGLARMAAAGEIAGRHAV